MLCIIMLVTCLFS